MRVKFDENVPASALGPLSEAGVDVDTVADEAWSARTIRRSWLRLPVWDLCAVGRWRDGQVVEEHVYYDLYGILAQLGRVPPLTATA